MDSGRRVHRSLCIKYSRNSVAQVERVNLKESQSVSSETFDSKEIPLFATGHNAGSFFHRDPKDRFNFVAHFPERVQRYSVELIESERQHVAEDNDLDHAMSNNGDKLTRGDLHLRKTARGVSNLAMKSNSEQEKDAKFSRSGEIIEHQPLCQLTSRRIITALPAGNKLCCTPLLPEQSPLKNVIELASLMEDIVQARIRYALAETEMQHERKMLGGATDATAARVKAKEQDLADLYVLRLAIESDRRRVESYRRHHTHVGCIKAGDGEGRHGDLGISGPKVEISTPAAETVLDQLEMATATSERAEIKLMPSRRQVRFAFEGAGGIYGQG